MEFDVVVLGAGLAGAAAALAAAEAGASVCVIAAEPGASALFSGAWRGPCPKPLRHRLAGSGYELHECRAALPHPNGSILSADYATASQRAAQLREDALVCGIHGLPFFQARSLAALWSAEARVEMTAATIAIDATPRAGWAPASLAACIERDPDTIIAPLTMLAQEQRARHVILPAVLGTDQNSELHARIQDAVGCTVGEALGVAPSLPGWRLQRALAAALQRAGVTQLSGRAQLRTQANQRVSDVVLAGDAVRGRTFVLATGKFIAGGITATTEFSEPAFGLPVWVEHLGDRFDAPEPLILTNPERASEQPLLRAGVHCDAAGRPVDANGDVVYQNVFVAGSVRADWSTEHGAGECAEDGWQAGGKAAEA